jgi:PhzF family phenazine biosynthesis protein
MDKPLKIFQIDAFTNTVFGGNPAAICVLESWLDPETMQSVASENNLSETAFLVKRSSDYEIRWFTPTIEVALCGHATLAAAFVLFKFFKYPDEMIRFFSQHSGLLTVSKHKDLLTLDFPSDTIEKVELPADILNAFPKKPVEAYRGKTDYLLLYESQQDVEQCDPDHSLLKKSSARGVMITSPGNDVDFVSRFFAPGSGIEEDPVTGSAHTTLTPFWSKRLKKNSLSAKQLSKRKGELHCEMAGDRVKISGNAVAYMQGEIYL